jgi:hypothetical protein
MASLEGIIKFRGALGELVAYQLNGKWVVRKKSSLNKKRVKEDAAFANSRKASQEFGGASSIGKFLRHAWQPILRKDKDPSLNFRLNQQILQWIRSGQGEPGRRTFNWSDLVSGQTAVFQGLTLNKSDEPAFFLSQMPEITRNGNLISLNVNTSLKNVPPAATHFLLQIHLLALPEFVFNGAKYVPQSEVLPLQSHAHLTLPVENALLWQEFFPLSFSGCYAVCLSLHFFQEINGAPFTLQPCPFAWVDVRA